MVDPFFKPLTSVRTQNVASPTSQKYPAMLILIYRVVYFRYPVFEKKTSNIVKIGLALSVTYLRYVMKVSDMRIKSDGTTQIHGFKGYLFNLTTISNFQQINFSHKLFVCLDL